MFGKVFTILYFAQQFSVLNGCGLVTFSNDSYFFHIEENVNISLSITNISSPFILKLRPSWDQVKFSQNNIQITDEEKLDIELSVSIQYIYQLEALCVDDSQNETVVANTSLIVARTNKEQSLQKNFGYFMNVFLVFVMFCLGTDLDHKIILNYMKRPIGPVIGILSQFVGMPLASYLIGYLLLRDQEYARLGLLLVGCSPGGTASNFWTIFFEGDINLSVTMTFCSSVASLGLSTLWIWALGSQFLNTDSSIANHIPYPKIFISILSLVLPVSLGMFFKYKKPDIAAKLWKYSRPVFLVFVLVSLSFGIYINRSFFSLVEYTHVISAILLSLAGFTVGALSAVAGRLNKAQIIAVSIETAIQNPSAAFLIMQTTIGSPYSDIGSLSVISYIACAKGPPMLLALIIYKSVEFIRRRRKEARGTNDTSAMESYQGETFKKQLQTRGTQNIGYQN